MTADPDCDEKVEPSRRVPATSVALTAISGIIGIVGTIGQLIEWIQSGKLNLILSAISALMVIVGIVFLWVMNRRWSALIGAAAMLAIIIFAIGILFFAEIFDYSILSSPPSAVAPTPNVSPFSSLPTSIASPVSSAPLPTERLSPAGIRSNNPSSGSGSGPTIPPHVTTRGSFTSPAGKQQVSGKNLVTEGNVEGTSSILLCIVKDESGNHFPYTAQSDNGQWRAAVPIGPQTISRPLSFTLILATATQSASDEIHARQQTDPGYKFHGLGSDLPAGIQVLAEVGIVRTR